MSTWFLNDPKVYDLGNFSLQIVIMGEVYTTLQLWAKGMVVCSTSSVQRKKSVGFRLRSTIFGQI